VAVLVTRPGHELDPLALARYCRTQLSSTKLPRLYACVAQLPIGASGKVLRRVVRDDVLSGRTPVSPLPKPA
jgi:long-chain acyl-CoA synthetase